MLTCCHAQAMFLKPPTRVKPQFYRATKCEIGCCTAQMYLSILSSHLCSHSMCRRWLDRKNAALYASKVAGTESDFSLISIRSLRYCKTLKMQLEEKHKFKLCQCKEIFLTRFYFFHRNMKLDLQRQLNHQSQPPSSFCQIYTAKLISGKALLWSTWNSESSKGKNYIFKIILLINQYLVSVNTSLPINTSTLLQRARGFRSRSLTFSLCSCSLFTWASSWALRRFKASMSASHCATKQASNSTPFSCRTNANRIREKKKNNYREWKAV